MTNYATAAVLSFLLGIMLHLSRALVEDNVQYGMKGEKRL
jgi:hypothetical protein